MEWIKQLLQKAVVKDDVLDVEELDKAIDKAFPDHAVPKADFNAKAEALKTATTTLETLRKDNKDNEMLQATIKTHEGTIKTMKEDYQKELSGMKMNSAIEKLLSDNNAKYPELLAEKFDRSKLTLSEDGQVIGLNDQFKTVKESYKDMFTPSIGGKTPPNPDVKLPGGTTFESLVNNADTMSAEEVAAQFAAMEKQ